MDIWKEDRLHEGLIWDNNGDIEFGNVDFSYPSRRDVSILRNFTLIARVGQKTALVGSSGCGKYVPKRKCISIFISHLQEKVHVYHYFFVIMSLHQVKSRSMVDRF